MVEEYKIYILKKVNKDKEKIKQFSALKNNVEKLISLIKKNPFQTPPSYEILTKDLKIMKNYPYAVAGYDFSDKKLKDYFSKFLWYIPIGKNVELTKDDYEVINNVDKIIKSRGK